MEERFGIPQSVFADYLLFKTSRSWALLRNDSHLMAASRLKVWKTGLKAFRKIGQYVKPTSRMVQIFGHLATRGKVVITEAEFALLRRGRKISPAGVIQPGYVLLSLGEAKIIGLGFMEASGLVKAVLPPSVSSGHRTKPE